MKKAESGANLVLKRPEEIESTPAGIVRRWLAELELADQEEKDWRKESEALWKKYQAEKAAASSFNIFWANTEIITAAIYNSTPQPDVRRRFRDADPVGKAASQILERSLSYQIDDYEFDDIIDDMVLDTAVTGRGVPRIKYEPVFAALSGSAPASPGAPGGAGVPPTNGASAPASPEPPPEVQERLVDESVLCEHVQWDKFRHGPGSRWTEVPWVAFEHDFTFDMAITQFGEEIAKALTYDQTQLEQKGGASAEDREAHSIFRTTKVQEIWDRDKRRVLFIAPTYKVQPCLVVDDPLKLRRFFPMPRPAYAIRNSTTLNPTPLYRLYAEQAKELDRVSARINKIIAALKVRGAYSAQLKELAGILEADDLDMLPVENPAMIGEIGGLDKAIWLLPTEKLIVVLKGLYEARNQIKQTIYEIMGISDIIRGASDPNETLGAQQIKEQWGSIRVRKLQKEIQRVIRDLMRLKAEVIAERFSPQILSRMTNVQLPTAEQKQQAQAAMQQAQQTGQQIPPEAQQALASPTWEEVTQLLRSDGLRQCRIDIETDSTVAETLSRDMQGLGEVMTSVGAVLGTIQTGVPVEVAKEIALAGVRRARLGSAVEDALENFPTPNPEDEMRQIAQQIIEIVRAESAKTDDARGAIEETRQAVQSSAEQLGAVSQANAVQVSQLGQAMQQVAQANQAVLGALGEIIRGMHATKHVTFERGASGQIVGAEATPVVQ